MKTELDLLVEKMNEALLSNDKAAFEEADNQHRALSNKRNYALVKEQTYRPDRSDYDFTDRTRKELDKLLRETTRTIQVEKGRLKRLHEKLLLAERTHATKELYVNFLAAKLSAIRFAIDATDPES